MAIEWVLVELMHLSYLEMKNLFDYKIMYKIVKSFQDKKSLQLTLSFLKIFYTLNLCQIQPSPSSTSKIVSPFNIID